MKLIDKLTAIGDAIRTKTGGTEELTLDQMVEQIAGFSGGGTSGNTSMFASTASGRIPEFEKGTALSIFVLNDLNFESNAVGALQEE